MPTIEIFFTEAGRREICQRLLPTRIFTPLENGFIEKDKDTQLTDREVLTVFVALENLKATKDANALNDRAEVILGKVVYCFGRMRDPIALAPVMDSLHSDLVFARSRLGRPDPTKEAWAS